MSVRGRLPDHQTESQPLRLLGGQRAVRDLAAVAITPARPILITDPLDAALVKREDRVVADPAIVSVVVSGAVGLTGLAVAAHGQAQVRRTEMKKLEFSHDEEVGTDLRAILDEAATAAMSIRVAITHGGLAARETAVQEIQDVIVRALEQLARLGVRVGPDDPVYLAYQEVTEALKEWRAARVEVLNALLNDERRVLEEERRAAADCKNALEAFLRAAQTRLRAEPTPDQSAERFTGPD